MVKDIDSLKESLKNSIVQVTFKKTDGSIRNIRATTSSVYIPPVITESKKERKKNSNITHLYDVDKKAWRSMKNENLIDWEIETNA